MNDTATPAPPQTTADTPAEAAANESVTMRSIIQRVATGPHLSKDLPLEEARAGMRMVLDDEVDPVQAGIFLIALRMKRETDEENRGILQALIDRADIATAEVDDLVDIADPFDGYNRTLPASPFLAPLLAALGVPAITHGVETMGPKYGVTHHQVMRKAGIPVDLNAQQAAQRIADPSIGWSYIDQSRYCKPLNDLFELRRKMIKRSVLTTAEVLVGPVRARGRTHLVTGYVHKPYPPIYASMARQAGFETALLVRGVEGGVVPSLRQPSKLHYYHNGGPEHSIDIQPQDLGIEQENRAVPVPEDIPPADTPAGDEIATALNTDAIADAAVAAGRAALGGTPGATYDSLLYSAVNILVHVGRYADRGDAAAAVRAMLDSGAALERLRA